ncbi:SDR family oxidoreductase [Aureliella helgolandensis]|uniref:Putative oxidoreductase n=1 Tax=Aureliella helgolandensis TaxID=2527968 RepID=A0A518FZP1_9BACT|nr:SDR family oxidoreductase [Aureliella helgolandensis]QDV21822.1 putative oxidoreductase [Aureliella helgolandensis]
MAEIAGKRVVIVGGGTGMGQAVARQLDAAGAKVVVGGRRIAALQETASGTSILTRTIDVASREDTHEFFAWATEQLGQIDVMINAAGINIKNRSMADMLPEQWDQIFAINATGAYNCLHAVLPAMRARKDGFIINISSIAGKRAIALGGIAYSASKFAMTALGTCVANEVAEDGVRVTNIYPGEVNTPLLEQRPAPVSEEHKARILQPEHVAELVVGLIALPDSVHVPELVVKPLTQGWY